MKSKLTAISAAVVAANMALVSQSANASDGGSYQSGDFHNHTTCSDGGSSVRFLTDKSLEYLDWFIQTGHSGSGTTDCRLDDFAYNGPVQGGPFRDGYIEGDNGTDIGDWWINTEAGNIKGDFTDSSFRVDGPDRVQAMWRWQSLQEFEMGQLREGEEAAGKPAFLAEEWVLPGHEHGDVTVIRGQYDDVEDPNELNPEGLAHFEYCFARPSNDTSGGEGQGWTCEISSENNAKLIARFAQDPGAGLTNYDGLTTGDYNGSIPPVGVKTADSGDHVKSVASVYWLDENYPTESFSVPAHVARQGAYIPDDDEGFNIEHFRDYHNAAPDIGFGFEGEPGHQAQPNRGSYNAGRPSSGGYTYGGGDCYANAEAARPGLDFDGVPLTPERLVEEFPDFAGEDPEKVVLCRPGVRTMWDAMLSEGRRYWYFGSSDWHNRGDFGPFAIESTNDFYPGEYQKNYAYIVPNNPDNPAQDIVDGLRSGDGYVVMGDLIGNELEVKACFRQFCAGMGETLYIVEGKDVRVSFEAVDPIGPNNSAYDFPNPSLLQIGMNIPVNQPVLQQVDMIAGEITGLIPATLSDGSVNPDYTNPLAPPTTRIEAAWSRDEMEIEEEDDGYEVEIEYKLKKVQNDMYIRFRGTNIPPGTPNETGLDGNPLPDNLSDNIPCPDFCPEHMADRAPGGEDGPAKILDYDLEAWAELWFHTNPIFIEVLSKEEYKEWAKEQKEDRKEEKRMAKNKKKEEKKEKKKGKA
jgi:hypothetical protein